MLPKIYSAFLNLTNACNLACRYCFVEQHPDMISLQVAKDTADFLAANAGDGVPSINFFGGEPLLMWDAIIVPLTEYVRDRYPAYNLSMTSNGTLLNQERAEYMRKKGIGLLLSMDGDRRTQERNRPLQDGGSSFDILGKKLPLILKYFPDVMFRSTVTPETAVDLFHDMIFAEQAGFRTFFTMPDSFANWDGTEPLEEELRRYSEHYVECLENGWEPIYFTQIEKFFPKILLHNQAIQEGANRAYTSCMACGKCGLGSGRYAGINLNGDILACQEFFSRGDNPFVIGNIYTGVVDETRRRLMQKYDSAQVEGDGCDECPLNRICDGGCVANNYIRSGSFHHMPPICCRWNRLLFREAIYLMERLGKARNKRFLERWHIYVAR